MLGPTEGGPPAALSKAFIATSCSHAQVLFNKWNHLFFLPNPVCLCATVGVCFKYFDLIHFAFRKKLELYL